MILHLQPTNILWLSPPQVAIYWWYVLHSQNPQSIYKAPQEYRSQPSLLLTIYGETVSRGIFNNVTVSGSP